MSVTRPRPVIPEELPKLLHSISYAVIKNQPQDIISFAAEHFQHLYEEREQGKNTLAKGNEEQSSDQKPEAKDENDDDENSVCSQDYEGQKL